MEPVWRPIVWATVKYCSATYLDGISVEKYLFARNLGSRDQVWGGAGSDGSELSEAITELVTV